MLRDRYEIVDKLGRGGFAITYKALVLYEPETPLCVVKEILSPQSTNPLVLQKAEQLFEKEARNLKKLGEHPRIPTFIEHFEENQRFYIVQEYIDGHILKEEFIPNHRWTEEKVTELLRDILEILKFVHEKGVIHRDITPSNLIRRNSDGKLLLIDFGAVKEIGTVEITESGQTRTTTIGTPGYTPPEQLDGQPRFCSDIYSVGLIAIQFLTGLYPLELPRDPNSGQVIWNYSLPHQPMLQVSNLLTNVLHKMVRYHFRNRYQSVAQVLQKLRGTANFISISWMLAGLTVAATGAIAIYYYIFFLSKTAVVFKDGLSAGEEVLFTSSSPRLKQKGVYEFAASNSKQAVKNFKES